MDHFILLIKRQKKTSGLSLQEPSLRNSIPPSEQFKQVDVHTGQTKKVFFV